MGFVNGHITNWSFEYFTQKLHNEEKSPLSGSHLKESYWSRIWTKPFLNILICMKGVVCLFCSLLDTPKGRNYSLMANQNYATTPLIVSSHSIPVSPLMCLKLLFIFKPLGAAIPITINVALWEMFQHHVLGRKNLFTKVARAGH